MKTEADTKTETVPDNATAEMEAAVNSALDQFEAANKPGGDKIEAAAVKKDVIDLDTDKDDDDAETDTEPDTDFPSDKDDDDTDPKDDVSPKDTEPADEPEPDDDEPLDTDPITDDLLEAAVKSGMSMKNARKFPDAESLREAIGLLSGATSTPEPAESEPEKSELESVLGDIPDLNPDEYDPELVKVINGLKGLVQNQHKEIQSLKDGKTGTWVETQINTLGDAAKTVRDDPGKKAALLKKYDILKAGYKATGESVAEEAVFQEAAQMVLGDAMKKQTDKAKADAARRRKNSQISRPSGQSAQKPSGGDDVADIVELVAGKFNIPK